jgi:hypothetical protein
MSELKSSIEYVLGISFESDNGLAIEFDGSPELIPMLQDRLKLIDISTSDRSDKYFISPIT